MDNYRVLGNTGLRVSPLCFGTMSFGGVADKVESERMFHTALDHGINFFDCADSYSKGTAEEILGGCIQGRREDLVLTTKGFNPTGEAANDRGLSRKHLIRALDQSLDRLKTDYIDIYFLHNWDSATPIEETLETLDYLKRQGKILHTGVSNWAAWQISKSLGISAQKNLASFDVIQPMYNLVKRQAEVELFPMAEAENLGVISYSPLGGGLLTGKYEDEKQTGRLKEQELYTKRYRDAEYFDIARSFSAFAKEREWHPATLAVAWAAKHSAVTAPIIGARNVNQLQPSLDAMSFSLTDEDYHAVRKLSIEPPIATDRSEVQG
ncbi:aldo/keto reductase [Alkalicoccus halolimnae]|uniref:Aldo/keto reductase n=1 Tax=Alkalicoccus halolimnae TaxID=1667239 RepID=A0A5C7FKX0_9BACI|nr:aldo/keto reductase [Alkalicoccus halolimnae]TXF85475.1 aldo/keto reductase [Alkalicoccus halolimnae]